MPRQHLKLEVSDHAILRFLERVELLDDGRVLRRMIPPEVVAKKATFKGETHILCKNYDLVLQDNTITTTLKGPDNANQWVADVAVLVLEGEDLQKFVEEIDGEVRRLQDLLRQQLEKVKRDAKKQADRANHELQLTLSFHRKQQEQLQKQINVLNERVNHPKSKWRSKYERLRNTLQSLLTPEQFEELTRLAGNQLAGNHEFDPEGGVEEDFTLPGAIQTG